MIGAHDDRLLDDWMQTRNIAYMVYCLGTDPDNRDSIEKFIPLRGDGEGRRRLTPQEMIKATKEKWKQIDERRKKKAT